MSNPPVKSQKEYEIIGELSIDKELYDEVELTSSLSWLPSNPGNGNKVRRNKNVIRIK